jgi:predicted amidohydrolase
MNRAAHLVIALALVLGCDVAGLPDDQTWIAPASPGGRTLRVAAVQFDARPEDRAHNLAEMERLLRAAAERGAELVLFHESSTLDYGPRIPKLAESVPDGPTCRRLAELAAELDLWLGAGLAERDGARVFVTHAFFGPDGFVARYRKTYLWHSDDRRRDEWVHFTPGDGPASFELAGLRVAALICADEESAACVRSLAALEPELVLFPNNRSNLHAPDTFAHLAVSAGAPVVLANRCGTDGHYDFNGGSLVLAADGTLLARANRVGREEVLIVDLPLSR